MPEVCTLPVFSEEQLKLAKELLAARVATMLGRKMEEDDWSFVYCNAKRIPETGWSNLNIDVAYQGLGVEHKMLKDSRAGSLLNLCGTRPMHPAGTRSIRPNLDSAADEAAKDVLEQYGELIESRTARVRETSRNRSVDMRFGWLIWKERLNEFLYFEEPMLPPNPEDYFAQWVENKAGGSRKSSVNLWIYERDSGQKAYSVTTSAGAKVQPYFQVPNPRDENLYHFVVQGMEGPRGLVEVWLTRSTSKYLELLLGDLSTDSLSQAILEFELEEEVEGDPQTAQGGFLTARDIAIPVKISKDAYRKLNTLFEPVSDEYLFQQFAIVLGSNK
jgi:hypothetical protein